MLGTVTLPCICVIGELIDPTRMIDAEKNPHQDQGNTP
jgi:hypothetical protein